MPEMVWDPLRRKNVPLTPEERVRQWFITVLRDRMKVPGHMMMSEVGFKYGNGCVRKEFRADIVVYDRRLEPMMLVECKSPDVELGGDVMEQALRYDMVLNVKYMVLTNGNSTHVFLKGADGRLSALRKFPEYSEMIIESAGSSVRNSIDTRL